jgi:hypothetical protein
MAEGREAAVIKRSGRDLVLGVSNAGDGNLGMPGQEDFAAKQAEYESHAEKMRQMAAEVSDEVERNTLLRIAEAWAQLAQRMSDLTEGRN